MLFNSIDFALFLPIVFILYWFVFSKTIRRQNLLIVIASYIFYGWWDWRFLLLVLFSTLVDYSVGVGLENTNNQSKRKRLLWASILVNLGFLGFFKYFNFFIQNFVDAFSFFGHSIDAGRLDIILPVGISFYTFQTLSYSIDVYRRQIKGTKDFLAFSAYVSFFPQLVAGPIERATKLLPQFFTARSFNFDNAIIGIRQMLWGFFMKLVIADNCAMFVNEIFSNSETHSGSTLVIGVLLFSFQIYCDFAGYSNIAIGVARLFGFSLMQNFAFPYFSRDIAEFWRRWHISLSTWFRDYLYIPLGGSKVGRFRKVINTFIIFVVSGFWHGANWTFVFWGALNAIYFLPLLLTNSNRHNLGIVAENKILPSLKEVLNIGVTFGFTMLAWIFFRSENLSHAFSYINRIFSNSLFEKPDLFPVKTLFLILLFVLIEWVGRRETFAIERIGNKWPAIFQWMMLYFLVIFIYLFGNYNTNFEFIYFQF